MAEKEVSKEKDVGQIVRYLSATFNQATQGMERAARTKAGKANEAYKLQTEFAYLLNEVVMGPRCVMQKNISACNEFIDAVLASQNESQSN